MWCIGRNSLVGSSESATRSAEYGFIGRRSNWVGTGMRDVTLRSELSLLDQCLYDCRSGCARRGLGRLGWNRVASVADRRRTSPIRPREFRNA